MTKKLSVVERMPYPVKKAFSKTNEKRNLCRIALFFFPDNCLLCRFQVNFVSDRDENRLRRLLARFQGQTQDLTVLTLEQGRQ
jgi:hypothetical protein